MHQSWQGLWGAIALYSCMAICVAVAAPEADPNQDIGWESLFDGKSLFGWEGDPQIWRVEEGLLIGQTSAERPLGANTFLIWQGGDVADFDMRFEYRLNGGNSGVQYRSQRVGEGWTLRGYQADFDHSGAFTGVLYEERGRGILGRRGEKSVIGRDGKASVVGRVNGSADLDQTVQQEGWNTYEVTARGRNLTHRVNGVVTIEVTDNDATQFADRGLLGLQVHAGPPMKVSFRNLQIRRLKPADKKKIVFMAGAPSHGYGAHEHRAGSLLLANQLNQHAAETIYAEVRLARDWPTNKSSLNDADAVVFYCDGGPGHMAHAYLAELDEILNDGCGLVCLHYGVEIPKGEGGDHFLKWIGGYFETDKSVNPIWEAQFDDFPDHPITHGVKPFKIRDEWYFNMRFAAGMKGVTPILSAVPPIGSVSKRNGPHQGNPEARRMVAERQPQHVAWAYERPSGGRGFGFTGGHFHRNWGDPNFRKLVLNALVWVAQSEVPADGIASDEITAEQLELNQDYPKP